MRSNEQYLVREAYERTVIIQAQYEWVTENVQVNPEGNWILVAPAIYENVDEQPHIVPEFCL